jgi:head-tail adaptor
MKSILDPTFRYVPSVETDVRKTFARVRREQRANAARSSAESTAPPNVLSLQRRSAVPAASR